MKKILSFCPRSVFAMFAMAVVAGLLDTYFSGTGVIAMMAMAGPLVSTSPDRASYGRFIETLKRVGLIGLDDMPIVTPTDLRLESTLTPSVSSYEFDLRKGTSTTDGPLENKLGNSDIFWVSAIGLGIYKTDGSVHEAYYTYPDLNYFSGAGEASALESIYSGKLSLLTDTTRRFGDLLCHHMRFVPPVQYDGTNKVYPSYGALLEERGYFRMNPNFLLDGRKNNKLTLQLGQGVNTGISGPTGKSNKVIVFLHGFLFSGNVATDQCAA